MATSKKINRKPRSVREAEVKKLVTKKEYSVEEVAELLPKLSYSNFTDSLDLNVVLNLKDSQKNESIRGSVVFPIKMGKESKVLVFAKGEQLDQAKDAGADYFGLDDYIGKIEGGWLDFDVVIATPEIMPIIAKLGKVLGPKQLMPNPKTGTVTTNVADVVKQYKAGKTDFKMDAGNSIKFKFGITEMSSSDVKSNLDTALDAVKAETRKLGLNAIKKIIVKATMGPAITLKLS